MSDWIIAINWHRIGWEIGHWGVTILFAIVGLYAAKFVGLSDLLAGLVNGFFAGEFFERTRYKG